MPHEPYESFEAWAQEKQELELEVCSLPPPPLCQRSTHTRLATR